MLLKNLQPFVSAVAEGCEAGHLTIDQVVFEPKHLIAMLHGHGIPLTQGWHGWTVAAEGQAQVEELLHAALGDWVDFVFVPKPALFGIFADHDEYTTFYAHTRSNLNSVVGALADAGFEAVRDYERPRPQR